MYTKAKKCMALILAALLLASCAATPDAEESTQSDNSVAEQIESVADTAEETEPPEYTAPALSFEGADFTIAACDYTVGGGPLRWMGMKYCESYGELTGDAISDALFERNNRVQEELDIVLNTYPFSGVGDAPGDELRALVMSGETFIDLASVSGRGLNTLLLSGTLGNMKDIETVDFTHSWYDQKTVETFELDNTLYAVASDFNLYNAYSPIVVFFNKQLIEDHGMENLYDMVREGTWTFDEMIVMAEKTAHDTNGNGEVDLTTDNFGIALQGVFMTSSVFAGGIRLTDTDEEGIPQVVLDPEKADTIIAKLKPLFANDNVTMFAEKIGGYTNVWKELFLPTFMENRVLFYENQLLIAMDMREMETDFGILPHPKHTVEQSGYYNLISEWWATFLSVPITNSRLEMTGYVMESLGYHSQQLVMPEYVERSIKGKAARDIDSVEMVDLIMNTRVYDLAALYDWGGMFTMFQQIAVNGTSNFASTFAKKAKSISKAFDKTLKDISEARYN